ncbi:hypothetical protein IFM89_031348 [Coptis chinensis]|uniref:Uncharacterized protein n=1 Tax=Coptis chinensis TaxID=261450 RepID=A0A835IY36_9MAGN|nr:hypothetical protein IFM89_031348 [Coptis chinensis]
MVGFSSLPYKRTPLSWLDNLFTRHRPLLVLLFIPPDDTLNVDSSSRLPFLFALTEPPTMFFPKERAFFGILYLLLRRQRSIDELIYCRKELTKCH